MFLGGKENGICSFTERNDHRNEGKREVEERAISSIVAAVKKVAIDEGHREDIPEELVDRVVLKGTKIAKEQLDSCRRTARS